MEHNADREGFSIDINRFTDWTNDEFKQIFGTKFADMVEEDLQVQKEPQNVDLELTYIYRKRARPVSN
jgi:hypothetical protein